MLLFVDYGYEGIGLFFTALEKFAAAETPLNERVLKKVLHVNKRLEKAWEFLKEIELIQEENGEVFSENLQKFSGKYEIKKGKNAERVKKFREKNRQKNTENAESNESVTHYTEKCNAEVMPDNKEVVIRNKEKRNKKNTEEVNLFEVEKVIPADKEQTAYQLCNDFWLKEYHPGWKYGGAQGKAMKSILAFFEKLLKDQGKETSTENVANTFKAMCANLPDWYKDKDLMVINSKINEIIQQIKNQKNGVNQTKQPVSQYRS